jgi:large subunit ribosomal protein L9
MPANIELLLIENVDSLGIVGDVVKVRTGYARNFLLPRNLATKPDKALIAQLAGKRADAEKLVAAQRKDREALSNKLQGVEIELVRSCNDMGILYGAITQQDIASALNAKGFKVGPRDVRLTQSIKRVENADVHVKLDKDLDAVVKVHVKADRELPKDRDGGEVIAASSGFGQGGEGRKKGALDMAIEEVQKGAAKGGWGGGDKKAASDEPAGDKKGKKADKGADKGGEKANEKAGDKPEAKADAKAEKPAKEKPAKK